MRKKTSQALSLPPESPQDRAGLILRKILDAQAWFAGGWGGHPALPPSLDMDPEILRAEIRRSPRGNGYLSLEKEVRLFGDSRAFLGYGTWGRNALITGGLHGERENLPGTLVAFRNTLYDNGFKRVLSFPVAPDERQVYEESGFQHIQVGAEAFLDLREYSLQGGRRESLRQMVNRAQKRFALECREVSPAQSEQQLCSLYQDWLRSRRRGYRMRLLVGTPSFHRPFGRRYFATFDKKGEVPWAFITITPGWDGRGYGLDVLARHPQAPAGAVDLLLSETIGHLQREGVDLFSLGACPLIEKGEISVGDPRGLRWAFRVLRDSPWGNHLFQFQSLYRFKEKFNPRWEPLYMAGWPNIGFRTLYAGCRMWGLFGPPRLRVD